MSAGRDGYDWFAVSFEIASFSFRPLLLRARHGQPCLSPQLPCPSTSVRICGIEYPVGCGRYEMTCHIRNLPVWRYLPPLGLAPNTKGGNLLFRSLSGTIFNSPSVLNFPLDLMVSNLRTSLFVATAMDQEVWVVFFFVAALL